MTNKGDCLVVMTFWYWLFKQNIYCHYQDKSKSLALWKVIPVFWLLWVVDFYQSTLVICCNSKCCSAFLFHFKSILKAEIWLWNTSHNFCFPVWFWTNYLVKTSTFFQVEFLWFARFGNSIGLVAEGEVHNAGTGPTLCHIPEIKGGVKREWEYGREGALALP